MMNEARGNVVLVHGGFVDGSGWQGVYDALTADGYDVAVVQNPTLSLEGDVATTQRVIAGMPGPVTLVGHSYGGAVITEAGTHEKVRALALVYVTAFAPDKGESVATLIADPPPGAPVPPILPPVDGFLFLDRDKFAESFAGDLPRAQAEFMAHSQVPWGLDALNGAVSQPAWRSKPCDRDVFTVEDHELRIIEQGRTDSVDSTSLHVPAIDLVVSGDVVYNQCHMFVAATTPESRQEWIAALDRLAALNPKTVVAGHKKPGAPDGPETIEATKHYLADFDRLQGETSSDRELYDAMTDLYPDWVSHQAWLMFGL
jgi:pimeloyl-ACP methyl ester carboxylesterase